MYAIFHLAINIALSFGGEWDYCGYKCGYYECYQSFYYQCDIVKEHHIGPIYLE